MKFSQPTLFLCLLQVKVKAYQGPGLEAIKGLAAAATFPRLHRKINYITWKLYTSLHAYINKNICKQKSNLFCLMLVYLCIDTYVFTSFCMSFLLFAQRL